MSTEKNPNRHYAPILSKMYLIVKYLFFMLIAIDAVSVKIEVQINYFFDCFPVIYKLAVNEGVAKPETFKI